MSPVPATARLSDVAGTRVRALWSSFRKVLGRAVRTRRPKMPPEVKAAFDMATTALPMPSDAATDSEWEAWANLDEVQMILAVWPTNDPDRWWSDLQTALELPGVRDLLGSAAADALTAGRWIARTTPGTSDQGFGEGH